MEDFDDFVVCFLMFATDGYGYCCCYRIDLEIVSLMKSKLNDKEKNWRILLTEIDQQIEILAHFMLSFCFWWAECVCVCDDRERWNVPEFVKLKNWTENFKVNIHLAKMLSNFDSVITAFRYLFLFLLLCASTTIRLTVVQTSRKLYAYIRHIFVSPIDGYCCWTFPRTLFIDSFVLCTCNLVERVEQKGQTDNCHYHHSIDEFSIDRQRNTTKT